MQVRDLNNFEFLKKEILENKYNMGEKLSEKALDKPILEQLGLSEEEIEKIDMSKSLEKIEVNLEENLDKPILEQMGLSEEEINKIDISRLLENSEVDFDEKNLDGPNLEQVEPSEEDIEKNEADKKLEIFKKELQEGTGWSDEIIEAISSIEEGEHYEKLGLKEEEINGEKCLIKENLDMENPVDPQGRTNKERMELGLSPIDENGQKIELHHIGQKSDGPLAELNTNEHRSKEIYSVLHENLNESEIDRNEFNKVKEEHWKTRSE